MSNGVYRIAQAPPAAGLFVGRKERTALVHEGHEGEGCGVIPGWPVLAAARAPESAFAGALLRPIYSGLIAGHEYEQHDPVPLPRSACALQQRRLDQCDRRCQTIWQEAGRMAAASRYRQVHGRADSAFKCEEIPPLNSQRQGPHRRFTWLHPKLAVSFAHWLDVDFAVWCDLHSDALMHLVFGRNAERPGHNADRFGIRFALLNHFAL